MKRIISDGLSGVGIFILVVVAIFILGLIGLGFQKFFLPKQENIKRDVFENTQSYVHGKIQDLGKYKYEYDQGTEDDRVAIRAVIVSQFSTFDDSKINNNELRTFLKNMRGF